MYTNTHTCGCLSVSLHIEYTFRVLYITQPTGIPGRPCRSTIRQPYREAQSEFTRSRGYRVAGELRSVGRRPTDHRRGVGPTWQGHRRSTWEDGVPDPRSPRQPSGISYFRGNAGFDAVTRKRSHIAIGCVYCSRPCCSSILTQHWYSVHISPTCTGCRLSITISSHVWVSTHGIPAPVRGIKLKIWDKADPVSMSVFNVNYSQTRHRPAVRCDVAHMYRSYSERPVHG